LLVQIIGDKHQTLVTKTGAILASGIMDAGGRNVVLNLQSKAGFVKMGGAIGMMMFLQYWYWYPLELMLSLAFAPTMLIGLNKDFNMPTNFSVVCHAPPSMFCYPKIEEKKEDEKKTLTTAVLSTTVKAKAREAKKEARKLGRQMSLTSQHTETAASDVGGPTLERSASLMSNTSVLSSAEDNKTGIAAEEDTNKPIKKEKEASSFTVTNPSRVIPAQVRFLSLPRINPDNAGGATAANGGSQRYIPIDVSRRSAPVGIVILLDEEPNLPEQVEEVERIALGEADEAKMPEPFIWDPTTD